MAQECPAARIDGVPSEELFYRVFISVPYQPEPSDHRKHAQYGQTEKRQPKLDQTNKICRLQRNQYLQTRQTHQSPKIRVYVQSEIGVRENIRVFRIQ